MAFSILFGGAIGALLPVVLLQALKLDWTVLEVIAGIAGGGSAIAGISILGARLNDRIDNLRATSGSAAIGADGIRWHRFGRSAFIGWRRIRDVVSRGSDVVVHVDGASKVVLPVTEADSFGGAAREALAKFRRGEAPETIAALDFGGENVADWLGRARALLQQGSTYRDADVGEERCVRVAIDPRAPIAQRIGSAAALSKASDDAKSRVRVAIEETADPEVASALEDALEARDDDRAVHSVLRRTTT
jgi:hypothetical protein